MLLIVLSTLKHLSSLASDICKQKKLLILIYHRVLGEPVFIFLDEIDNEKFLWHMDLISNCFKVLTLNSVLEIMRENSLPARAVWITTDDEYMDIFYKAVLPAQLGVASKKSDVLHLSKVKPWDATQENLLQD